MPVQNPRHSRFFWRSSAMFCILDEEHLFKEVNTAWERTLGLTTGQLLAKRFIDFVHPEDKPSTDYYFEQLKRGIGSVSFSNRFAHREGFYRQVLWEVNSAASKEYAFYVVGMDVTEREQPMVADEMISVLQEGVVLQYANGTIGASNPSAERILGLSADQMMGWTLVDPDWRIIREDGSPFPAETHPAICTLRTGQSYADVVMGIVRSDETTVWLRVNSYPLWRDDVTQPYAVVISFSDITLFKQAEQYLRQEVREQPEQAAASENAYDLWDWDLETNEVHFSARWKEMLGFAEDELKNHVDSWHKRIHPADYKRVLSDIQNHLDGATQVFENTHRLQHKDGSYRWILSRAVLVRDPAGKPHRLVGTHVDVTEPRRIEEELTESEKRYKQLMETTSDAVFIIEVETLNILDSNRNASQLYGYSRNELLQLKQIELSAQPDKTEKAIKKGVKFTSRQYHRKQDGTVFSVEVNANPFIHKGRQIMMMYVRDISEQQRIETALWESESKYRQLFEASSSPTVVFDANSQQFFDVNRAAIDLYGYTKEEWLRMSTEDVSAESVKRRSAFGSSGKKVQVVPLRWHKKKDGTVFPVEIATGSSYLFQGRSLVCATLRDITERKAHEEALRKEKDFVDTLVQASPAFFFAINPDGKTRMVNKAMLSALDYNLEEVIGEDFLTIFILEGERSAVSVEFDNLIKTMRPSLMENHVVTKLGKTRLVEWHSRAVVKADGTLDFLFGVGVDVTERKEAQGHLQLFRSMFEVSQEAISISDAKGNLMYTNAAHEKLFSYTFKESTTINCRDFYPAESLDIWEGQVTPALSQGKTWEGEFDVVDNEGNVFSIWMRADAIRDSEGNILFKFCFMHDISERQQTWETLHRQWEEQQMIFNTVPAMIWYRDRNNHLLRTNALAAQTFKEQEAQMASYTDCEEVIRLNKAQLKIMRAYQDTGGNEQWMRMDKIPCWNNHGDLVGVIIFAMDVTEYKQIQTAISQESAGYMNIVTDNMPVMLVALDTDGHIVYWNRACEEMTGYRAKEMIGSEAALIRLFAKQTDRQNILDFPVDSAAGDPYWESSIICREGKTKTIAWRSVCQHHPVPGWHVWHIGQDVTQHKQMERLSRETRSLLPQVLELSKLGICLTDDRGRILQVNRAFAEFYGFKTEELIGQRFTVVLPTPTHDEEVREYYSLLLKQNESTLIKQRNEQHRNGQAFEVQVMASRVILEDKRRVLISFVSKLTDIKRVK